ncbi:MAG: PTS glucitol/sorbitol transporter subunit IIA [Clostridium sp.]|uniref:PTS glucitol/sorbitol transporter subunit IIA n=1 Tax=Clostridium sp. TaxID=1506 RepID=UPI0025C6EF6C|nr:PTS glucitol/sorbitol transporter subunit IIA [Clostridium sp.]MCH3965779.1 PTS glucitol/sorbitol transporter subunit IIA [Clostridium sp.]MCI1717188.1 PTS glucitol/sorbitol transporter subunit IIA [Clostridium sp.]MCI1801528.1 PTS glucitol/sorbitol transporter subunit IIA [Clostridium sp.]MCI1815341.1 PTS glucitol/sorbitol transporter subunit IIA [Clostridium sp.]MCI1872244.1 PTS glucitol/sorbitol transporter subunit IIA [Clostridium sp.]
MKYKAKVTGIGDSAFELFEACNSLVIFNDNAPAELAEISILHTIENFKENIAVGDKLILGNQTYIITSIGDEAIHTLKEMGHCTLKFSEDEEVDLPGQIALKGSSSPDVNVGDIIAFV